VSTEQAESLGVTRDALYAARKFAGDYDATDLQRLCRLCLQHQYPLGTSTLARLLSVPKAKRRSLVKAAIAGHWTIRKAEAEIRQQCGRRRKSGAGRPFAKPETREGYYSLLRACERWQGLVLALGAAAKEGKADVTEGVQEAIERAKEPIEGLRKLLVRYHLPERPR